MWLSPFCLALSCQASVQGSFRELDGRVFPELASAGNDAITLQYGSYNSVLQDDRWALEDAQQMTSPIAEVYLEGQRNPLAEPPPEPDTKLGTEPDTRT